MEIYKWPVWALAAERQGTEQKREGQDSGELVARKSHLREEEESPDVNKLEGTRGLERMDGEGVSLGFK